MRFLVYTQKKLLEPGFLTLLSRATFRLSMLPKRK